MDIIDWSAVNWLTVFILAGLAFVGALIGNFVNMIFDGNPITGAILTAVLFAVAYLGWTYYPHGIDIGQERPAAVGSPTSGY